VKNNLVSFVVGFVFAIGLGVSGMTQPQKIIGFFDLSGNWDPSLIFVMLGAISVHFFIYKFIKNKKAPLLSLNWHVPTKKEITPALVFGGLLFGVGWGLAGYCPGPALASIGSFNQTPIIFIVSMIAGMFLFRILDAKVKFRK
jgi:uncharacterized membrane protein YedE/YeeE